MLTTVMLFSAGFGTRMGDLTKDRPKPLIPVAGKPLIEHALQVIRAYGAETVVANAHYKAEQIVAYFEGTDVRVSVETPDILDTGGGLKAALPLLNSDTVFTVNTDAVWHGLNPLRLLADAWTEDQQALLLCVPLKNAIGRNGRGDINIDSAGHVSWGNDTVYTGVQILRTELVSNRPQNVFSLKAVWEDLLAQNALRAVLYPGFWCDVGHPEGIKLAEDMLETAGV